MFKKLILAACSLFMATQLLAAQPAATGGTHVLLTTSAGEIEIEVNDAQAPISARNFLEYVQAGFYNGTIFHRVIPGFMIQGGGFTADLQQKDTERAITNEAYNGLLNDRGTVAMARTNDPNSATSQFFINLTRNEALNASNGNAGYAVFGKVVRGMDVVDKIATVSTGQQKGMGDVPMQPLLIISAKRL